PHLIATLSFLSSMLDFPVMLSSLFRYFTFVILFYVILGASLSCYVLLRFPSLLRFLVIFSFAFLDTSPFYYLFFVFLPCFTSFFLFLL
ncbi:hypothetical protein BCR41DRAFT_349303, partial [Lobosporangium transversale]